MDAWDGYVAAHNRVLDHLLKRKPKNPVVITGDVRSAWVSDLKADFRDEGVRAVGTEFVGTSITLRLRGQDERTITAARQENPSSSLTASPGALRALQPERGALEERPQARGLHPGSQIAGRHDRLVRRGGRPSGGRTRVAPRRPPGGA